jgi:aminoglycoside phosphotransferase (APT) family kinase protein
MCAARMHADEADIDTALVRRLLTAQFPRWAELLLRPVDSAGTENALYRPGEDMAVRLPRRDGGTGVERRQRWLRRLAPGLPVAVPDPLGSGRRRRGLPLELVRPTLAGR